MDKRGRLPLSYSQIKWRCRRGTRELDHLVSWWFATRFEGAPLELQRAFCEMLDLQDPCLWDLIAAKEIDPVQSWSEIIGDIRNRFGLIRLNSTV